MMSNSSKNSYESHERQNDELNALKAIFANDLKDLRHTNGDNDDWHPIEVQITLQPMVSMSDFPKEVYIQLDLYVKCGKRYPEVIPEEIALKNVKGLSSSSCQQLRSELYEMAKTLRGEVMIYEFTDHVRQYLHKHNKPPIKSFYDEMVSSKTKLEMQKTLEMEKQMEIIKLREEEQRKMLEEELQRKQIALIEESRLRRESFSSDDIRNYISFKCTANHGIKCLTFRVNGVDRKIQKANCIFHNHIRQSIEYLGLDLITGESFIIIEWVLQRNNTKVNNSRLNFNEMHSETTIDDILSRVSKIDDYITSKLNTLSNINLVNYLSLQYSVEDDFIFIYLLQDFINGNSLYHLSKILKAQPIDVNLIRHYSKQILEIMNYLHKNHCYHGDLRETNIYVDNLSGNMKISGYYVEKQIYDLYCDINLNLTNSLTNSTNIHRLMIKDVFQFGVLMNAISKDWNFSNDLLQTQSLTQTKNIFIDSFNNEFRGFIEKCTDCDENARWTCESLLQHPFIHSNQDSSKHYLFKNDKKDYELRLLPISNGLADKKSEDIKNNDKFVESTKIFNNTVPSGNINSRFVNEFEVIDELGKGGFGYVYRVKNILDGRCYALKKILINPSNQMLYQKIRREVNLLSRLNHENVVRYFCSWIESETNNSQSDEETSSSEKITDKTTQIELKKNENSNIDDKNQNSNSLGSSDEDEDDGDFEAEEDIFGTSFLVQIPQRASLSSEDDQYVIFEGSFIRADESKTIPSSDKNLVEEKPVKLPQQYMYIQMELCEKSTLRDAIDNGLVSDTHRKRRLFREIVEGLVHIHQQGMIHRDLKPGNIFLDSNDHVKIGDFGLAKEIYFVKEDNSSSSSVDFQINLIQEPDKFRLTGKIGTPFYVAPELTINADTNSNKIFYTQKVDIYSLGIIFFEMSYPFQTSMERTKVILALRKPDIILPDEHREYFTDMEIEFLKSLLHHNYTTRPSSSELLASDYLPAPEMAEKEEQNVIRRAVQNPRTKLSKYMLSLLFQRDCSEIEDYVYDVNDDQFEKSFRTKNNAFSLLTKQRVFQYVYNTLQAIMVRHCAVSLSLPTLIPKHSTRKYESNDIFHIIDRNGSIVALPHDLRVPFARYIARNQISLFRRYSIEKVYRQQRVLGYHPRELWECAFDIVTPKRANSSHILPDAEVLCVLFEVIQQFPMLIGNGLVLKLNHIMLLKAVFNYCDIAEEQHDNAFKLIAECNDLIKMTQHVFKDCGDTSSNTFASRILSQKKKILEKLFIDDSKINLILQLIDTEQDSIKKLQSIIKTQMRKKSNRQQNALEMAKTALKELDQILSYCDKLGKSFNKFSIKIKLLPGFLFSGSSFNHYSGMIFQLEREIKLKKNSQKQRSSVIAVGGRYDDLISHFYVMTKKSEKLIEPKGAVGVSIEFEKIMKCILDEEFKTKTFFGEPIDVVVCSLMSESSDTVIKELCNITKEFWTFGIKVFCFPEDLPKNSDDLHAFCLENCVKYAIVLKENSDPTLSNYNKLTAKLIAYEKERFIDKKGGTVSDIVEYVTRTILSSKNELNNVSNGISSEQMGVARSDSNKIINCQPNTSNDINYANYGTTASSIASNIKVTFITMEKLQPAVKRRHENNIISHLSSVLNFITSNNIIEVLAVDLPFKVVKTIAGEIEFEGENDATNAFETSKLCVIDKYPRFRKFIFDIMDTIYSWKVDKKSSIINIISINDNMKFKILS